MDYREEHEHFVSNLNGTTVLEVSLIGATASWSVFLHFTIAMCLLSDRKFTTSFRFFVDFMCLVLPILMCTTILSDHSVALGCTMLSVSAIIFIRRSINNSKTDESIDWYKVIHKPMLDTKHYFISWFRAYTLIATALTILAVDFQIFPRRLAKTEYYGTGLMDIGVGSFVVSNAIVSSEARSKQASIRKTSTFDHIVKMVKSAIPLLILGGVRLISVKATDYQEHVSEYGVHWNFFFTLAFVKVLSSCVMLVISVQYTGLIGVGFISIYQYMLSGYGLSKYILYGNKEGPRHGFIDANREGLFSCIGYLAIYLMAVQLGIFLFRKRESILHWIIALVQLTTIALLARLVLYVCERHIEPVSRRMANLSYVVWMVFYNVLSIATFLLVQIVLQLLEGLVFKKDLISEDSLLSAYNYNGLLCFLLSNVLTGIVNFSIQTIHSKKEISFLILLLYLLILSLLCYIMFKRKIKVKFW